MPRATPLPPPLIRVLLVDDHPVVRDGLRGILAEAHGFTVVGEADDGHAALAAVADASPDVVLMDLRMPGLGGVEAIRRLSIRAPEVRALVLTTYDTDRDVVRAIGAGAAGYLLKDTPAEELRQAVRAAAGGAQVLSPGIDHHLGDGVPTPAPGALSDREVEVLRLIADGASNREVAAQLFISEATVKTHLLHAFAKLEVSDRTAAVTVALRRGLLTLDDA